MKEKISAMIEAAIGSDVITGESGGFVSIMGKGSPDIQYDIPAVFEAYTLLAYFLNKIPLSTACLTEESQISLSPAVLYDKTRSRLLALVPIESGELSLIAYWLTNSMRSEKIKQMPGILALPFSIENLGNNEHIIPEWYAAFYVDGTPGHCIPILTLRSILQAQKFGGDWVSTALERMRIFALPQKQAVDATIRPA